MSEYFRVELTPTAHDMLRDIGKRYGKKTYEVLRDLILDLEFDPAVKGQALRHPLHGLYSLHYSRFRVIYSIDGNNAVVLVVGAGYHRSGARDDVYQLLKRMVQNGNLVIRDRDGQEYEI